MRSEAGNVVVVWRLRARPGAPPLLRAGEPVPLEPKAYELLSLLLERRPRALSRAKYRDAIWAGTYVSESTLGVVVNAIRQALGDEARQPRFIRTVHGFGYAFCGKVRESTADAREPGQAPAAEALGAASPPRWRVAVVATGVLALLGAGWLAIRWTKSSYVPSSVPAPKVVPLTSFPGAELHPALSPDGTRVAFIWDGPKRDNFDVYVKDIASGDMVRVTQDPAPDYRPAWSPDGKHLAFLRARETGAAVFVVSVGGQEQRLVDIVEPVTLSDLGSAWVHWSPDGRFLAVADRVSDGASWGIVLVSVETGEKRTLTANMEAVRADFFPTFSPDGRRIAFLRGRLFALERDLLVQPLSRGTPPQARGDAVVVRGVRDGIGGIAWLPSGDELVVGERRISLDGSPPLPFGLPGRKPTDPLDPMMDSVSVRETRLAFDTPELWNQLVSIPLVGAAAPPFAPFFPSTRGEWDPAFSPDGRKVAFGSWRSGECHIWIGAADGSACRKLPLPPGSTLAGSPSWSPRRATAGVRRLRRRVGPRVHRYTGGRNAPPADLRADV